MVAQLDGRWGEAFRFAPGQVKLRFLDWPRRHEGQRQDTKADRPRESRYVQEEQDTRALISSQPALLSWLVLLLNRSAGSVVLLGRFVMLEAVGEARVARADLLDEREALVELVVERSLYEGDVEGFASWVAAQTLGGG